MEKRYIVKLTEEERNSLLHMLKTGKSSANKLMRARVLLETDESGGVRQTDDAIGKQLHVCAKTVARIRQRCVELGVDAALERQPHSNPKGRKIDGNQEAHLIAICCSAPPEGKSRWTIKMLADRLVEMEVIESVSTATVCRTLKKMN